MVRHLRVVSASFAAVLVLSTSAMSPVVGRDPVLTPPATKPMLGSHPLSAGGVTAQAGGVTAQAVVPTGFTDQQTLTGLVAPTVVQFAPDGRVFVAEKRGIIKVYDSLTDTTPTTFADLRTQVDDYWDRGLLGMALAPNFPTNPYVYVLYTYDAPIGGTAPVWNDACPTPPGPTTDGCVVSGRLSRLQAAGDVSTGPEQVLINDWCQQHPSHSIGTVAFGPDGALYVSAGDGASFDVADYGQTGGSLPNTPTPVNPCADPTGEGGALRSQDLRTTGTSGGGGGGGPTYNATVMADSPVAYWRLGETSGTVAADQKGTSPGTYTGSYALGQTGALSNDTDKAISVGPGAGYVSVPDDPRFDLGDGPFTIEFWAKRSSTGSGYLLNKGTGGYGVFFAGSDNKLHFEKVNTQATAQESGTTDQAWHHWAIVQAAGTANAIIYKDGVNSTTPNNQSTFVDTTGPLEIGRQVSSTPFFGGLDEVAIYNKTLTPAQVAAHYAARTGGGGTPPSDPTTLDGSILRLDPTTGAAMPDNPNAAATDANARRIVAYGHRNPFRFTFRPSTNEMWIGDVGWDTWEEIDLLANPVAGMVDDGWPCYEGAPRQPTYDSLNLGICESLYTAGAGAVGAPYYAYSHTAAVVPGDTCPTVNGSSISGLAFYNGGSYPASYNGGLFFSDYTRRCIWFMPALANGRPNAAAIATAVTPAVNPVYLTIGPGGDLVYVDYDGGTIHRLTYAGGGGNQPPVASPSATPTSGAAPLAVAFSGTASSDPEGAALTYAWDFDGNGTDDATTATASHTYTAAGTYQARLRVTDPGGLSNSKTVTISVNSTAPVPTIQAPSTSLTYAVGDSIPFSGGATDQQDGVLPASKLSWTLIVHHCPTSPTDCHTHSIQTIAGVSSGSFSAPDHGYPSWLEIVLTATDSGGLQGTTSVNLNPKTVVLSFATAPSGLQLAVGSTPSTTPFTRTVIQGSRNTISATTPQTLAGSTYAWQSWSDAGLQSHDVIANSATTYTATYQLTGGGSPNYRATVLADGPTAYWRLGETSGTAAADQLGTSPGTYTGSYALGQASALSGDPDKSISVGPAAGYVTVPDSTKVDFGDGPFTIEFWAKRSGTGSGYVLNKGTGSYGVFFAGSDNKLHFEKVNTQVTAQESGTTNQAWHYWVIAQGAGSTNAIIYKDGVNVTVLNNTSTFVDTTGPLEIGRQVSSTPFYGGLDEFALYNKVLTAAQVAAHYAARTTP